MVYGRQGSEHPEQKVFVPTITEIRRVPKEETKPLGGRHRRRTHRGKSVTMSVEPEDFRYNPEEGWDEKTDTEGVVIDYDTKQEVKRRA